MVKDIPLSEITLRRYEKPYNLTEREIVKKICLSLGLLQPGDSRDIIVDILLVLLNSSKSKQFLDQKKIKELAEEIRKKNNLDIKGLADSNIRRQLKRLKDLMIVEKLNEGYRIVEFESLSNLVKNRIEKFYIYPIIERVHDYLDIYESLSKENQDKLE